MARPDGGGGLNGCSTKKKKTFFNVRKKVSMATKPRGGGGLKALVAWPLIQKNFFCGFPYETGFFLQVEPGPDSQILASETKF